MIQTRGIMEMRRRASQQHSCSSRSCLEMRMIRKRPAREILFHAANGRLTQRRTTIRQVNGLLSTVSLDTFHFKPKDFNKDQLARMLRLFARRCASYDQKQELRAAVQLWVDNQGQLPDGLVLVEGDIGLRSGDSARSVKQDTTMFLHTQIGKV